MRKKQKKKINRIAKYLYLSISVLMIVFAIGSIYNVAFSNDTSMKSIYTYDSNFKLNYNVNLIKDNILIKNNIVDPNNIPMGRVYVTDLLDNFDMNFGYNYKSSTKTEIDYTYKITAVLKGVYTEDGVDKEVLNKQYTLLEPKSESVNSDNVKIDENLKLNVRDYIEQIRLFEQTLGIKLKSNLALLLSVNVKTVIDGKNLSANYVSDVSLNIGEKTTDVSGKLTDDKTGGLEAAENTTKEVSAPLIVFDIVLLLIALFVIRYVLKQTTVVNIIRNEYKLELNKILKICQDKIVQVSSPLQIRGEETIEVKDFQEIIKLSEELSKPILCYISKQKEESLFAVITNGVLYRYILKGEK
ncbi:MAG: DUF5305 domain-containing protein [Oscillospiraceae bacterium]|nr:DUF5305 domain-containing protein [Oscillospiraceae bacterium]